jgi:predicted transcriptional regulator of viral defense system
MIFQEFRRAFFELVCFSTNQVYAWREGFDKNNFVRWSKQGLITRLKPGFYSFPEYLGQAGIELFIGNRMYKPSYISLHSALAFYGLIPEAVVQVTSISALKTKIFVNPFGTFTYKSVKSDLIFGYDLKPLSGNHTIMIANPEKALLDLLYLYPFYSTRQEMENLRLDEDFLHDSLNVVRMKEYISRFSSKALENRAELLIKTYAL